MLQKLCKKHNGRFNLQRTGFKHPEQYGYCCILTEHLNGAVCKYTSYNVQILEKIKGSDKTERGKMDASKMCFRKSRDVTAQNCFSL